MRAALGDDDLLGKALKGDSLVGVADDADRGDGRAFA